jgi:hypothetical protein
MKMPISPPKTVADLEAYFDNPKLGFSPAQRALVWQCLRSAYEMGQRDASQTAADLIRGIHVPSATFESLPDLSPVDIEPVMA